METNRQSATHGQITYYMESDFIRVTIKSALVGRFTVKVTADLPSIPATVEFLRGFNLRINDLKYRAVSK